MSEEDNLRGVKKQNSEEVPAAPEYQGEEPYDVDDDDVEEREPLTSEEFRAALRKLDALGVTWTADRIPHAIAKKPETQDVLFSKEVEETRRSYPNLPSELGLVVFHALTGDSVPFSLVGGKTNSTRKLQWSMKPLLPGNTGLSFSSSTRSKCLTFWTWIGRWW